jgi:hypothetical protein
MFDSAAIHAQNPSNIEPNYHARIVRAINRRRALPFSAFSVSFSNSFTSSASSTELPPRNILVESLSLPEILALPLEVARATTTNQRECILLRFLFDISAFITVRLIRAACPTMLMAEPSRSVPTAVLISIEPMVLSLILASEGLMLLIIIEQKSILEEKKRRKGDDRGADLRRDLSRELPAYRGI